MSKCPQHQVIGQEELSRSHIGLEGSATAFCCDGRVSHYISSSNWKSLLLHQVSCI